MSFIYFLTLCRHNFLSSVSGTPEFFGEISNLCQLYIEILKIQSGSFAAELRGRSIGRGSTRDYQWSRKLVTVRKSTFGFPFRIDIAVEFLDRLERRPDRVSCGHFRAVPTARISSFIRHGGELRARAHEVSWNSRREWRKKKEKEAPRFASVMLISSNCRRFFFALYI